MLPTFDTWILKLARLPALTAAALWLLLIVRSIFCRVWLTEASLSVSRVPGSPLVTTFSAVFQLSGALEVTLVRSFRAGASPPAAMLCERTQTTEVPAPAEEQVQPAVVEPLGRYEVPAARGMVTVVGSTVAALPPLWTPIVTSPMPPARGTIEFEPLIARSMRLTVVGSVATLFGLRAGFASRAVETSATLSELSAAASVM